MVVITITLTTTDRTAGLLHGMGIIGMRGFLIIFWGIGHICRPITIKSPMDTIVTMNRQAMGITILWFIMVLSVGTMDIRIHILGFLTIVILMHIILIQVLTITTIRQAIPTLTLLRTTRVVLEE